ncbi:LTA synthase family protein [Bacillus sp. FJAT-50079]|uniref:LTA synthase family protein n=1 Tax=Bacillus sp. FJAT-50079 TaxID=2833577 RepID=UPI001BCA41F5|nr:LTA synthase family protein [Bacillus sp. FJAT-50079]MBS4207168.1 LTA synthase family protein [Bacillus sp. FJAT-50079]
MKWEKREKNEVWFLYICCMILLWIKMGVLYRWVFHINVQSTNEVIALALTSLGSIAFLLGITFVFRKQIQSKVLLTIYFLLTLVLFGNMLYYRFYIDFITVPVLLQFQNVGGLSQSTVELMKLTDLFLFVDIFIFMFITKKGWLPKFTPSRAFVSTFVPLIIVIPVIVSILINPSFWKQSYDKELIVKSLGLYYYHVYDALLYSQTFVTNALADETEIMEIQAYTKGKNQTESEWHGVAKNKNVVLIFLESTQNFVIDYYIEGQEVTPFLNELKKESLYFPNFYHQTAQGKTSDAEFIIDNGLFPLSGGSVFVRKPQNTFYSLPHILKEQNYVSASFHGNDAQFWNRSVIYDALGYDHFFSKEYYDVDEQNSINYGLKDIPFLQQTIPYLQSLSQPFYAKLLLLTNHFPFLLEPEDQFIAEANTDQGVVNRYFTTVRYEDEAIKTFFEQIANTDLYKNSIFVLVGDHYGLSRNYYDALGLALEKEITPAEHISLQKVPLIIHIPGIEGQVIDTVGGQIDLRATILDLLGIKKEQKTIEFGSSLMLDDHQDYVIFRDGSFATKEYVYTEGACLSGKTGEKVKRNKCTPYIRHVQQELTYSDKVIYGDLLRFTDVEE